MAVGHASDMTPSSSNYNFFLILYRLLTQPAWFLFLQSCFSLMYVCVCVCVCVCVYVLSLDNSPPGSSVHRIFQARILEWVVISYSRRSSLPRHQAHVSCVSSISRQIFFFLPLWHLDTRSFWSSGSQNECAVESTERHKKLWISESPSHRFDSVALGWSPRISIFEQILRQFLFRWFWEYLENHWLV